MSTISGEFSRERLLVLIGRYMSQAQLDAVGEAIGDVPDIPFNVPPRIVTILFCSRSGSSYAGRLLAKAPYFRAVGEAFAPDQLAELAKRQNLPDMASAAHLLLERHSSDEAFGYKAGFYVLAAAAYFGFLSQTLDRTHFILLRRRDRLAQAISLLKADISGRYHSSQSEQRTVGPDDYDAEIIARNMNWIAQGDSDLANFVDDLCMDAPTYYYEDICASPGTFVGSVCSLLGFAAPEDFDPSVNLEILRDSVSEEWAQRFRNDRPELAIA